MRFFKSLLQMFIDHGNADSFHESKALEAVEPNNQVNSEPVSIKIENATRILLPKLKFEKEGAPKDQIIQDWDGYWKHVDKTQSYYRKGQYFKVREEINKLSGNPRNTSTCQLLLLRTYRKIINSLLIKKKYYEALIEFQSMFSENLNITNTDIKTYNKIFDSLSLENRPSGCSRKELISKIPEDEMKVDSILINLECTFLKPKGLKLTAFDGTSIFKIRECSNFLPLSLPYVTLSGYSEDFSFEKVPQLKHTVYRLAESPKRNAFIACSDDQELFVYDWDFNRLQYADVSAYSSNKYHLRQVNLSAELSHFLFTNIDIAYLLNSRFQIVSSWKTPPKDGWEKRKRESTGLSRVEREILEAHSILGTSEMASVEEIKSSFRKLALQHHPDKNPDDPNATHKMRQLIEAYEYLTNEKARTAFRGLEEEEYWVDTFNSFKINVGGFPLEINVVVGSGEDWIYGSGISEDGTRIYLGCYSGKIYQMSKNGECKQIYVVPEDEKGQYGKTNPISSILERGNYLHILSYWYLYILENDKTIKCLKLDDGEINWFEGGFIHHTKNSIHVYSNNGNCLGSIVLKDYLRSACFDKGKLMLLTNRKCYIFGIPC